MKTAVVVGATSGIGRAVALALGARGYAVGVAGRRTGLLRDLVADLPDGADAQAMDVTRTDDA